MHCAEVGNQLSSPFSVDLLHTLGESGLELPSGIFVVWVLAKKIIILRDLFQSKEIIMQ